MRGCSRPVIRNSFSITSEVSGLDVDKKALSKLISNSQKRLPGGRKVEFTACLLIKELAHNPASALSHSLALTFRLANKRAHLFIHVCCVLSRHHQRTARGRRLCLSCKLKAAALGPQLVCNNGRINWRFLLRPPSARDSSKRMNYTRIARHCHIQGNFVALIFTLSLTLL